jgi:ATP-dependent RNA helicase DDX5/DBP2
MSRSEVFRTDFLGSDAARDAGAADMMRTAMGIEVQSDESAPGLTPAPMQSWSEMGILPPWIGKSLQEHKWEAPMPVQAQAFPILLGGRNLIGIAQTGSGKTIAFMLPAVIHAHDQRPLSRNDQGPIVLVLAPTRELAVQIGEETDKLIKYSSESSSHPGGLRTTCFYGGGRKWDQLNKFSHEGSHFVMATPGRLLDCIAEGAVSLRRVTYFCLDEADRMLDMGFVGDMESLGSAIRQDRQMAFFSATWPKEVESLAHNLCTSGKPVTVRVSQAGRENTDALQARESIYQQVIVIEEPDGRNKWGRQDEVKKKLLDAHLAQVLASDPNAKVLIFVNEKHFADELADKLWAENVRADTIHGGRQQEKRLEVLDSFRQGDIKVLIGTDVVGRGLDIPNVTHVVVYNMNSVQDYIHRIGRTGRGKNGTGHALVFFEYTPKDTSIAGDLVDVLMRSRQGVPPELQKIADEVKSGTRKGFWDSWGTGGSNYNSGQTNWKSGGNDWKDSDWKSKSDWNAASWKPDEAQANVSTQQPQAFPGFPPSQPQATHAYPLVVPLAVPPGYPPVQSPLHPWAQFFSATKLGNTAATDALQ